MDWKREIKLGDLVGRKSDDRERAVLAQVDDAESPVATVTAPEASPERAVATPGDTSPVADAALADAPQAGGPPAQAAPAEETAKTSFWKRELKIRKGSDTDDKPSQPGTGREQGAKGPSRYARPGTPAPASAKDRDPGGRRSRFTRPGAVKEEATAVKEPRKGLFGRPKDSRLEEDKAPKRSRFGRRADEQEPSERRSRFSRPGAKPAATSATEPRARGRSPLAREISFKRRRKAEPGDAGGSTPTSKRARKGEVVGLKVGASHVSAAHVVNNGAVEVVQIAREPIERGVVVGGELRDPAALGTVLAEFFRRNKLPQKAVRLGIGTNRIGVRRLEIAGLQDRSHLENAIRFRAQEVLPIPLEEAVLDYQVVGETTDEKGNTIYRVMLVVAYRDLIQRYVQACRAAGLKLVGIDLDAFALLRALGPQPVESRDDAAVVIVSIGHDRSTFVVADGNTCEFARVLDWGGSSLDVALARALDKTPSQVTAIKHSLTLNTTHERIEGFTDEQAAVAYEAMRKELQAFVRELVSSLHFYQNQPGSLGIGELTITGGTAQLPGLAAELQRLIGVGVRVGDPFSRVTTSKRVESDGELGSLAVAIGLGIEG